jgi:hypothetical protein
VRASGRELAGEHAVPHGTRAVGVPQTKSVGKFVKLVETGFGFNEIKNQVPIGF